MKRIVTVTFEADSCYGSNLTESFIKKDLERELGAACNTYELKEIKVEHIKNWVKCKDCVWWNQQNKRCLYNAYAGYTTADYSCKSNRAERKGMWDEALKLQHGNRKDH